MEAWKLLVARMAHPPGSGPFLAGADPAGAMTALLGVAKGRWPGLLDAEDRSQLAAPELHRAAELLQEVDLVADELAGLDAIFEFMVSRAARGEKGQFFTPRHVVRELVRMVAPAAGEQVADPACGSGAFLHAALRHAPGCEVFGFDQDPRAVRVARTLLAAAGQPCDRVQRLDSLQRGEGATRIETVMQGLGRSARFDVVLANPPFAGDVGDTFASDYALAATGTVERDVLFLERCVGLLKPGGRLAIVLPHNKLGGHRWSAVRQWMLAELRVFAVLGLGRNTFLPHTSQKTCVVIARRRERAVATLPPAERVLFFVSDHSGKDGQGRLLSGPGGVTHDLGEPVTAVRAALADAGAR